MGAKTRVLDCFKDAELWAKELQSLSDIYFLPEWIQLHVTFGKDRGLLFQYKEDDGSCYHYPFIMRPIPDSYNIEVYDIESAYGYGGPLSNNEDPAFLEAARSEFEEWCKRQKVVAEFCAFHPFFENERWMTGNMQIFDDRKTVSIDLLEESGLKYGREGRYMVRRAQRANIKIEELCVDTYFDEFIEFYIDGMKNMGADAFYFFNEAYFTKLKKLVIDNGWLMVARLDQDWLAASLFIYGKQYLHYHLSVNNTEIKAPGATNLILDVAAKKGRDMGLRSMHLGGGRSVSPSDTLLKFKKSMASTEHQFRIGKSIHDTELYQSLSKKWASDHPDLVKVHGSKALKYRFI